MYQLGIIWCTWINVQDNGYREGRRRTARPEDDKTRGPDRSISLVDGPRAVHNLAGRHG